MAITIPHATANAIVNMMARVRSATSPAATSHQRPDQRLHYYVVTAGFDATAIS